MLPATHSQRVWQKIRLAEPTMDAASDLFWHSTHARTLYPQFLIQLHHVVVGGLRLMAFAAELAASLPDDPVAKAAAAYLRHHIEEERDHAEWLLDDLRILGVTPDIVARTTPLPAVASLIGEQFFWISAFHPVVVFGYLLVLEGSPPIIEQLQDIQQRTGLPADAFRCLKAHAEDDPAHLEDLNRTLDRMPLTAGQEKRIALSAFASIESVATLLDDLLASALKPSHSRDMLLSHA